MKKFFTLLAAVCLFFAVGCNGAESPSHISSVVLVVQQTANSKPPMINSPQVIEDINTALISGGQVVVIMADGAPFVLDVISASLPDTSKRKKQAMAAEITDMVMGIALEAEPATGDIDVLEAFMIAARNADPDADENKIYYLGSALATTGIVSFSDERLLGSDTSFIIDRLTEMCAIPEFPAGSKVILGGIGDVCEPQAQLSYSDRKSLQDIWSSVCTAGGAEVSTLSGSPNYSNAQRNLLPVSTVTVFQEQVSGLSSGIRLGQETVSFEPDSYKLTDPQKVSDELSDLCRSLIATGEPVLICGATATDGPNSECVEFGRKRACTIADILREHHVPESQINILGLGYEHPLHIQDVNADGSLNSNAQLNRCVYIFSANSAEARLLHANSQ